MVISFAFHNSQSNRVQGGVEGMRWQVGRPAESLLLSAGRGCGVKRGGPTVRRG